ncbi:O-antigen polymerase [Fibrobacter sp.]|uniref:O-antigen polymerase n=1 Tax=Fibrobacter sp. TaxID=35828 RepID=UPI00386789BD
MVVLYCVFCFFAVYVGRIIYSNFFNPICLYSTVWGVAVLVHQSDLIVFYNLTPFCWVVIFASHLLFVLGCIVGWNLNIDEKPIEIECVSVEQLKKWMLVGIVVTMSLAAIAIVANLKTMISIYGFNLMEQIVLIYGDRVNETQKIETIPYLGSFIFITLPLLGCYLKRFGFHLIVIPCVFLACADALISGGRAGIVFAFLLFLAGYMCMDKGFELSSRGRVLFLLTSLVTFALMIFFVSQERADGLKMAYATDLYKDLFGYNVALYKGLAYIAGPIGTLNEYLRECEFYFGKNSFLTIYNVLARLGLMEPINHYQEFFSTPMECNVGTWVREIIEDFTLFGAVFFIPFFGVLSSFVYSCALSHKTITMKIIWSIFAMVLALSFFDWRLRSASMWIAVLFGFLVGKFIDRKSFVITEKELEDE